MKQVFETSSDIADALNQHRKTIDDAELIEMARSGKDCAEIAQVVGFSIVAVRERLRARGVQVHRFQECMGGNSRTY